MPHSILIADDDPKVLTLLERYLGKSLGYRVKTVPNGSAALACGLVTPFDLCFINMRMPDLSGTELYSRLKNHVPLIEVIFFTTAQDFPHDRDLLRFMIPPERILIKPLDELSGLTRLVISILGPPTL